MIFRNLKNISLVDQVFGIWGVYIYIYIYIYGFLSILTNVISGRSDIYQMKSIKVFSYIKTGPAPVWLDSENYSHSI